jgi:hypothetical protein
MAVTITIKDNNQPYVSLHTELSEYLSKLGFKYLKELSQKDPYDDFALERELLNGLKVDLKAALAATKDQSIEPPPAVVGLEADEEQFGWKGLAGFAERFLRLIDGAEKTGAQIIWIGD